jgi:2'-5' RNA ligase
VTEPSRRVFFALWPDAAALDALEAAASAGVACCGGRRMRRDSLHLTLAFIGAVNDAQLALLHEIAAGVAAEPYELVLDRLGWWRHNRILWAGCGETPSHQRRLYESLAGALATAGFRLDPRPHVPHLTLLRHARCDGLPELAAPIRWRVEEFSLVESGLESAGARYRVLKSWPLHAIPPG